MKVMGILNCFVVLVSVFVIKHDVRIIMHNNVLNGPLSAKDLLSGKAAEVFLNSTPFSMSSYSFQRVGLIFFSVLSLGNIS